MPLPPRCVCVLGQARPNAGTPKKIRKKRKKKTKKKAKNRHQSWWFITFVSQSQSQRHGSVPASTLPHTLTLRSPPVPSPCPSIALFSMCFPRHVANFQLKFYNNFYMAHLQSFWFGQSRKQHASNNNNHSRCRLCAFELWPCAVRTVWACLCVCTSVRRASCVIKTH